MCRGHYTQYVSFVSLQINPLQAQLDMKGSSLAPKTLISVSADQALQLTLTRSSVGRILSLVDVSSSHAPHFCDWVDGTSNRCTNHSSCWYTDVIIHDSERNANYSKWWHVHTYLSLGLHKLPLMPLC